MVVKKQHETHNHSKYRIRYHIILSVKYHRKLLAPIVDDLKKSMKRAQKMSKYWKIEVVETDLQEHKDHHVHILVKAKPQVAPHEIVSKIKQVTTYDMWKQNGSYLRGFFRNGEHHLWTRGFFVSTIGDVSENTLKEYINRQG